MITKEDLKEIRTLMHEVLDEREQEGWRMKVVVQDAWWESVKYDTFPGVYKREEPNGDD